MKNNRNSQKDRSHAEWMAEKFKEIDWPIPVCLSVGFLGKLAHSISITVLDERPKMIRSIFQEIYAPIYLSTVFLERYSKIIHIRDFKRIIDQSIKAYFSGYKYICITALLPVIEGIVRKIATKGNREIGYGTKKIINEFQILIDREMSSPYCYGERLVVLEVFRNFVRDRLFKNTEEYKGRMS